MPENPPSCPPTTRRLVVPPANSLLVEESTVSAFRVPDVGVEFIPPFCKSHTSAFGVLFGSRPSGVVPSDAYQLSTVDSEASTAPIQTAVYVGAGILNP